MNNYAYDDIYVGLSEQFDLTVTSDIMDKFRDITGDLNPLHNDRDFAIGKNYPDRIVYGMLTASFLSTLAGIYLPGKNSLIHSVEIKFVKPVMINDKLIVKGTIYEMNDTFHLLTLKVSITNQQGDKVCRGNMKVGVLDE